VSTVPTGEVVSLSPRREPTCDPDKARAGIRARRQRTMWHGMNKEATRACHLPWRPGSGCAFLDHCRTRHRGAGVNVERAQRSKHERRCRRPAVTQDRQRGRPWWLIHAQPGPLRTPRKPSRNGYKPPTRRSSPKPTPQKEDPGSNPSGHPHSCRKTLEY